MTRCLVTGVTSGIGQATALALARHGWEVVLAGRDPVRLAAAAGGIRSQVPEADLHELVLDLADLPSVWRAAAEATALGPLGVLVNNAGVVADRRRRTADGFELALGTNHLGHFALTGLLLPALVASGGARVVTVSSLAARLARSVPTGDLHEPERRRTRSAYAESKLANLLFTLELDRRSRSAGWPVTAVAAHPGYASTELFRASAIGLAVTRLVGQPPEAGALPVVTAATEPGLAGGSCVGPGGPAELNGPPRLVGMPRRAHDADLAARLWEASERATGVRFDPGGAAG